MNPPRKALPLPFCFPLIRDRVYFPKFWGVTSFCLCHLGLLIEKKKLTWMGAPTRCPALGLTSCPVLRHPPGKCSRRESVSPSRTWRERESYHKAMNRVCKAEKAPATGVTEEGKGDLRRRGQGYLQSTFTNFNLLA